MQNTSYQNARLTLVATPIGRADDLTLHAKEVLASADVLMAEDTRILRKLLQIHGIALNNRIIRSYHDHNAQGQGGIAQQAWADGQWVAYAPDAGTPLISDPGYDLVRLAQQAGVAVDLAPGPSAVIAALCLSGQPNQRFFFGGFLPTKTTARQKELRFFKQIKSTGVYFESPRRLLASLRDIQQICGTAQELSVCRELTKKFQEISAGTVADVLVQFETRDRIKGEIVLVLAPAQETAINDDEIHEKLTLWLSTLPVKEVAQRAAKEFGIARKTAYQRALAIKADQQ